MNLNRKRIISAGIWAGSVLLMLTIGGDGSFYSSSAGQNDHRGSSYGQYPFPSDHPVGGNEVQHAGTQNGNTAARGGKKPIKAYSAQNPVLAGLSLGDSDNDVIQLHGNPVNRYVMDDGETPISVYDYQGFSVGFNGKQRLEFVDVTSPDAEPGLNGLRLGQHEDDAVHALGKPDTNTGYVLSYQTKSTVLKLDVDPKTKTILSIKLFAR